MDILWIVLAVLAGILVVLMAVAAWVVWKIRRSDERALAKRIARLRFTDKLALALALFRDARVPPIARVIALALVLYLAMPLDIVPDFIPVLGYADDVLIVLIAGGLLLRSIPRYVIEEHVGRYEAEGQRKVKESASKEPGGQR